MAPQGRGTRRGMDVASPVHERLRGRCPSIALTTDGKARQADRGSRASGVWYD